MTLPRSSGLLLHPSSLPGPYGIGDLGTSAYRWIDTLAAMKQSWWQILPLGPTGYGNSPYQSFSAFAGNVNLLSPEFLVRDGLLHDNYFVGQSFPNDRVDFDRVSTVKKAMLREAWHQFAGGKGSHLRGEFEAYRDAEKSWLPDFALFMAVRDAFDGKPLVDWPEDVRHRQPVALGQLEKQLGTEVNVHTFGQFLFDRQWSAVRRYAAEKTVRIIGDAPIFVAGDSADVWANPDQFLLDAQGKPTVVAGVPPDYFSEDGQLWGNPLYDWDRMAATGYAWWVARLRRNLAQVDLVRLDHFRGFAQAWHVPTGETTAKNGKWVDGPRAKLFSTLRDELGTLPIIAEDLGLITPDVDDLRTGFALPGMRVLQFALGGPTNPYWPHNYEPNTVAYTGTHDNDTSRGWFDSLQDADRKVLSTYVGHSVTEPSWELMRLAWGSVAALAIAPLQDVLSLGGEARMNVPGVAGGNWDWRFRADQFPPGAIDRLAELTVRYNRFK